MKITARCDYACKALLELAMRGQGKDPLQIEHIAKKQKIPIKYLVHILIQLKRLGIIQSVRGKEGGYILSKSPDKIKLGLVIREMCGPLVAYNSKDVIFSSVWSRVEGRIAEIVDNITFEDLCGKAKGGVYSI